MGRSARAIQRELRRGASNRRWVLRCREVCVGGEVPCGGYGSRRDQRTKLIWRRKRRELEGVVIPLLAALAFALLAPPPALAQDPSSPGWRLRVLDAASGAPLAGVVVTLPETGAARATDSLGVAAVGVAAADRPLRVMADRLGYQLVDTVLVPPAGGGTTELRLERAPVGLPALTAGAGRAGGGSRELARVIFRRDVAVGAVAMTAAQVGEVPAVGEADVLRSLASLAGVTSVNDYRAGMHVRGGASDQVGVWKIAPFVSIPNITGRDNPYSYDLIYDTSRPPSPRNQIPPVPFIGVDFRF